LDTQSSQPRIALLIDFDNVYLGVDDPPGFDIELVVNALRVRGVVVLGRAYGDWYRHSRHRRKLMEQGIELVETPAFGPIIKNSADIRIALDGLEIGMTQHHISEFCLVSGDSDFLPLIKRLQYLGKTVVVISGTKFTADLVRKNCNEFISYENLLAESVGATEDATTLEGAFVLLSRTINSLHERGMEVRSSTVKQMMLQLNPVFSERNFGCSQFKQFLDKGCRAGIIKLGRRDPNSGEFTVLLPSDFEDEPAPEVHAIEPAPAKKPARKVRRPDEDLGLHELAPETRDETETEAETANGNGDTGVASRALRRGRLRFSGKTWKGGSRSVVSQPGEEAETAATAPQEESTPEAGGEAVELLIGEQMGEGTPALSATESEAAAETAGEEPVEEGAGTARKRGTRGGRRRKTASKTAAAKAAEAEAPEPPAAQPVEAASEPEAAAAEPAKAEPEGAEAVAGETEEKPKAAAKKATRRRRAPAKKKAE
jgi:uncharacterized LabA/DUF88 family protein